MSKIRPYVAPHIIGDATHPELKHHLRVYSDDLYDNSIGLGIIAIREGWPDSLVRRLAAALISNNLGIGADYALRKYVNNHPQLDFDRVDRLDENVEFRLNALDSIVRSTYDFAKEDFPEGEFFSGISLLKSMTTLRTAHHLAQQGYLLEPFALVRTALEIIAWSRGCHDLPEGGDYLQMTTTSAISASRQAIPGLAKLYGTLSKFAHWHPDVHLAFMTSSEGVGMITRSIEFKISSLTVVSAAYLMATNVFVSLMLKYWPAVELSSCRESIPDVIAAVRSLISIVGTRLKTQQLVDEVVPMFYQAAALFDKKDRAR